MANILVIDDDKDIQRLLEFTLKRAGHSVIVAQDGEQGLQHAENDPPELIVCDVMMPKMTGYEFCRRARAKSSLKETPIIVFSARFQPIDKQTALDAGATDYISKATAPDALVKRITDLLPTAKPKASTIQGSAAVFSLRGGAGATSLAVNLAMSVSLSKKIPATLIDLAPMGGHAALMLGLRPSKSIGQLIGSSKNSFSAETITPYLLKHSTGVQLLASTPGFGQNEAIRNDQLLKLIGGLKNGFPITLLDVPHLLEPNISPILQLIDKVVLVLTPDMPSVQATVTALQGLTQLGYNDQQIVLVVNQISPHNSLPLETIKKAIRRPVAAAIPFEANMIKAANIGKPLLMLVPQSPASVAIARLSARLFT